MVGGRSRPSVFLLASSLRPAPAVSFLIVRQQTFTVLPLLGRSSCYFFPPSLDSCLVPFLARFLMLRFRCAGNLPSSSSGTDRSLPGALSSFRAVRRGIREPVRAGLWFPPADHQRGRRALSRLRQSEVRLCPDPVPTLPGGTSADVFL